MLARDKNDENIIVSVRWLNQSVLFCASKYVTITFVASLQTAAAAADNITWLLANSSGIGCIGSRRSIV